MLKGERVLLRAVRRDDVEVVMGWEHEPATWRLASDAPYVPKTVADALKDYDAGTAMRADAKNVPFVVEVDGEPVGTVSLWGIDLHNRRAHLGITMGPQARGKGYGTDAIRVLLRYAFLDRGLNRVQLETLASNEQALSAYRRAGFVQEGIAREDNWIEGRFVDQVVMSVLAAEWAAAPGPVGLPE